MITVEGGVVQGAISNNDEVEIILVDYDNIKAGDDIYQFKPEVFDQTRFDNLVNSVEEVVKSIHEKNKE